MITSLWYWSGAGTLAPLAVTIPIMLIVEGEVIEAIFVGVPAQIALSVVLALASGMSRKD